MSEARDVAQAQAGLKKSAGEVERTMTPAVNIFEDGEGISLLADMPGVSRDRLNIQVDSDSLTVEGTAEIPMPEGMQAVYADVRSTRYRRSFSLSSELDVERIDASLKDGLLTVRIPKREKFQPRKIEVRTS
ncbi:MAG: Hsp20/alpha crystallin family protein [Candidatus Thiodiazotropha taylori]|nr:Hsp20/alpha crystallin family protein [Candidatus Thiodiazotropha taylori]MCG7911207.1 Hsp20/alpha crystallin family protein [Candidatus Thiodiazotropha taylori]MCG8068145.1 Hsp20/alpha crystallin family protein [Candidatus Thiodiazotropha taylori]